MKKFFYFILSTFLCLMVIGCAGCVSQNADETVDMSVRKITNMATSTQELLTQARSAVVGIAVDYSDGYSIGSGFAISADGLILTNNHVVEGGGEITLYFADKTTGSARTLWTDASLDLAVLKSSREIPYLDTYTGEVMVGDEVFALGTPLTLEFKHTITHGIVSAVNRTLESQSLGGQTIFMQSLIQHDAAINPGNSGGPLINSQGQVIGINTLKASEGEGIGFAVPIEVGKVVVENLGKDQNYTSPKIGIFGFDSDIARAYGETLSNDGVYVVSTEGPAQIAGITKGDLITNVAGEKIVTLLDLKTTILSHKKGDALLVNFVRDNKEKEVVVTLS